MGLRTVYLDYMDECISSAFAGMGGKEMLELGDQVITDGSIPENTGKEYFENRGFSHTSFDLNGMHGAIKVDLAEPIEDPAWLGRFDVITDSGTLEHVEPYEAQYESFKNVHDCLKVGGVALHLVPDAEELKKHGKWKKHCNNYYSREFMEMLAQNNSYEIISLKVINGLTCACLKKTGDAPFMEDREEFLRHITRKKGGTLYAGINDTRLQRVYLAPYRLYRKISRALSIKALIKRPRQRG